MQSHLLPVLSEGIQQQTLVVRQLQFCEYGVDGSQVAFEDCLLSILVRKWRQFPHNCFGKSQKLKHPPQHAHQTIITTITTTIIISSTAQSPVLSSLFLPCLCVCCCPLGGTVIMEGLSLSTVVKYLGEKEKLRVAGQYRYDMRSVIMSLNNESMDSIKVEFGIGDNRIDLQKFLWLLRHAIACPPQDHFLLYYELVKLFEEIDVDNSATIEWPELLEYLSHSAWLAHPPPLPLPHPLPDRHVLFPAFRERTPYRKHLIRKVIEVQRAGQLGVLTANGALSFVSCQQTGSEQPAFSLQHVDASKVLSLDFAEEERLFGVLLANRNLCFIEEGEMQKSQGVIRSSGTEVSIAYLPLHRLWLLESVNSTLTLFPSPKGTQLARKTVFRPHTQPLAGVSEIGCPLAVVTASLDGVVKLWQVGSSKLIIELRASGERGGEGEEGKGVRGIATHSRPALSYIASWMFTSEIFLWLPSLSLSKPFAGELKGHVGLVQQAAFTWRGELVSIDDRRMVKVWNVDKFECLQNFSVEEESVRVVVLRGRPYVLLFGKLLHFYRMRTHSKVDLQADRGTRNVLAGDSHSARLVGTAFSTYYCFLVIVSSQQAQIHDVNANSLVATLHPPSTEDEFVSFSLKSSRRVYLGTSGGRIVQFKLQDGQPTHELSVFSSSQTERQLKFVHYHEQTKMVMAVVEANNYSEIITYDAMGSDLHQRVKEIDFQQHNLSAFAFDTPVNRFYLLSSHGQLTVWDYDKLAILACVDTAQLGLTLTVDPIRGALLLHNQSTVSLLRFDPSGNLHTIDQLHFQLDRHDTPTTLVAAALQQQTVPSTYLEQMKSRRTRRNLGNDRKRKVDFRMFDQEANIGEIMEEESLQEVDVLAIADNFGQVFYYNLADLLGRDKRPDRPPLSGKAQRVKEKRKAHMKPPRNSALTRTHEAGGWLFNQEYSFVPQTVQAGTVMNCFYFHSSDNVLWIYTPLGQLKAEWNLSISRPKSWDLSYNEIQEVMARLDKTEKALQMIHELNTSSFKLDFLVSKYLKAEEIEELQNYEQRRRREASSTYVLSRRKIDSRKSILSINDQLHPPALPPPAHPQQFQQTANQFELKQQLRQQRKPHPHHQQLMQKIQKSLSVSKAMAAQVEHHQPKTHQTPSPFVQQLENFFNASVKQDGILEQSSIKSLRKENSSNHRRTSLGGPPQPSHPSTPTRQKSATLKSRVKSSLTDLTKNFLQTKTEVQNFLQGWNSGSTLLRRGKVLKL